MKALTLRQPWGFAIAHLSKDVENRDWDTRTAELMGLPSLIGQQIAIHGGALPKRGKNQGWREFTEALAYIHTLLNGELPDSAARFLARRMQPGASLRAEDFLVSGVVAVATISRASRDSQSRWAVPGCLHLELSDVMALPEPVACAGAQGFWAIPEVIEREVLRQIRVPVSAERIQRAWGA